MERLPFLLEIGTEEIPARMVGAAAADLGSLVTAALSSGRLAFDPAGVKSWWTPRRLVLYIPDLSTRQEDLTKEVLGPPVRIAFGPDGAPTKAAEGFAKTAGVPLEIIGRKATPKGEVLAVTVHEKGRAALEILPGVLPPAIAAVKFKKSMRWAGHEASFVRPVRWILAMLGGETIKFSFGPVASGAETFGLRNHVGPIHVNAPGNYFQALAMQGLVLDPDLRKASILEGMQRQAAQAGGTFERDDSLLDEVTNLVECPVPFLGSFDQEFLALPPELLRVTMKHHQRYFPVRGPDGSLTNHFIGVSNTQVTDQKVVTGGNERVLKARLKDAAFFFEDDRKKPLSAFVPKLSEVIFQAKLGTYFDKKERVKKLAAVIAASAAPGDAEPASDAERTAELCKADLVTGMVGEFPELQGIMGRHYARLSGEKEAVAAAIEEHYMPVGASGALPSTSAGAVVSVADKLDTIAGCFHAGLKPTGSADPYALRRAALGIIRIIIDRKWTLDLDALIGAALAAFGAAGAGALSKEIDGFFKSRLKALFSEEERADVVDAFLGARDTVSDLHDLRLRFDGFRRFRAEPYFESFATAFKRAQNISKEVPAGGSPDPALFTEPQERTLYNKWLEVSRMTGELIGRREYTAAMEAMGKELLGPMHEFFEKVFVEVDDAKVRDNRKALLKQIVNLFSGFADFSRMEFRAD